MDAACEEDSQQPHSQMILETDTSKLPSSQINRLQLKFGAQMQTYISPIAREQKQEVNKHQYAGLLQNLQKHLYDGSTQDR